MRNVFVTSGSLYYCSGFGKPEHFFTDGTRTGTVPGKLEERGSMVVLVALAVIAIFVLCDVVYFFNSMRSGKKAQTLLMRILNKICKPGEAYANHETAPSADEDDSDY